MRTKAELLEMVRSRELKCPDPQMDDLQDVVSIFKFLTFEEAADLLSATGASKFDYWNSETPQEALQHWMRIEELQAWPEPMPYDRRHLMDELMKRVAQYQTVQLDNFHAAAAITVLWTYLFALEDGDILIWQYRGKGSIGGEFYFLRKAVQEFYTDDYRAQTALLA